MRLFAAVLLFQIAVAQASSSVSQPSVAHTRFWEIRISDVIMIAAVVVAPFFALWAQWRLQLRKEGRDRRLWIFKTLMRTRATPISVDHVQALNLIDVEFCSPNPGDQGVRESWDRYLTHLNRPDVSPGDLDMWVNAERDLLADMLNKMAVVVGYHFDFTYLKTHTYYPRGHGEAEVLAQQMQKDLAEIVAGRKSLKMEIATTNSPVPPLLPPRPRL